jgi:hypothetical protein
MDVEVDVVRQVIGFLHDAFPRQGGGSATLSVTVHVPVEVAVMGGSIHYRVAISLVNIDRGLPNSETCQMQPCRSG